jgi:hypothetical protein
VLSIVTLVFLTMFLMIGLPDFKKAALGMLRPEQAAQVDGVLDEVTKVISSSLVGNLAISVIAGSVVGVTAVIIGAPFPVALAVIVGVFDLVTQIGSTIAAYRLPDHPGRHRAHGGAHPRGGDHRLPAGRELPDPARGLLDRDLALRLCDDRKRHGWRGAARRPRGDPCGPGHRLAEGDHRRDRRAEAAADGRDAHCVLSRGPTVRSPPTRELARGRGRSRRSARRRAGSRARPRCRRPRRSSGGRSGPRGRSSPSPGTSC